VCALTRAEGPAAAATFASRHPELVPEHPPLPVPSRAAGPGRVVLPVDGLDGFFVAVFRRPIAA